VDREDKIMKINYWDCEFCNASHENFGTDDEPDFEYVYGCDHPNGTGSCRLDNKWDDDEDDCGLLNKKQNTTKEKK